MGKKKDKKAAKKAKAKKEIALLATLISAGRAARENGQAYHTTSVEIRPRFHNRPDCHDGKDIEDKNIRPGEAGRPLCEECRALAGTR